MKYPVTFPISRHVAFLDNWVTGLLVTEKLMEVIYNIRKYSWANMACSIDLKMMC